MNGLLVMLPGMLGGAMIVLLILAIRISYAIERLSQSSPGSIPTYTNIFSTAFGRAGEASPEALRLRGRLRAYLLAIAIMFAVLILVSMTRAN